MIQSKKEYYSYLKADAKALNIETASIKSKIKNWVAPNYIWRFQKRLRKVEYYKNCANNPISNLQHFIAKIKFRKTSLKMGFSIPENVFGPGLSIVHYGTIVINSNTKIGANCRIHASVNIGASGGSSKAPQLGDNIYIGPGSKIYGDIKIGNNTAIGTNAVVNKSYPEGDIMLAGNPAKKIKSIDIRRIIKHLE